MFICFIASITCFSNQLSNLAYLTQSKDFAYVFI